MNLKAKDIHDIIEHLALQKATEHAQQGLNHGSTICRLPAGSWQADIIRKSPDMHQAKDPMELRRAMQNPDIPVIFLSRDAIVTREVIDRICTENPLNKMIIWETA